MKKEKKRETSQLMQKNNIKNSLYKVQFEARVNYSKRFLKNI